MGQHLQEYVESVADLPAELQRSFKLLQELDQKAQTLQQQVDTEVEQRLAGSNPAAGDEEDKSPANNGDPTSKRARLAAVPQQVDPATQLQMNTIMQLCEEKVNVAQQIYDLVDQRILQLDRNLQSFDTELIRQRHELDLPDDPTSAAAALEAADPKNKQRRARKSGAAAQPLTPLAPGPGPPALQPDSSIPAAADPGEPVYCYCQRVSYGEMIACDNPECPIEWFHFECVGIDLATRPKGKWFCKECTKQRSTKLK